MKGIFLNHGYFSPGVSLPMKRLIIDLMLEPRPVGVPFFFSSLSLKSLLLNNLYCYFVTIYFFIKISILVICNFNPDMI